MSRPVPVLTSEGLVEGFRCAATGIEVPRACFQGGLAFANHALAFIFWSAMHNYALMNPDRPLSKLTNARRCSAAMNAIVDLNVAGRKLNRPPALRHKTSSVQNAFTQTLKAQVSSAPGYSTLGADAFIPLSDFAHDVASAAKVRAKLVAFSNFILAHFGWEADDLYMDVKQWYAKRKTKARKWSLFVKNSDGKWVSENVFESHDEALSHFKARADPTSIKAKSEGEKVPMEAVSTTGAEILLAQRPPSDGSSKKVSDDAKEGASADEDDEYSDNDDEEGEEDEEEEEDDD